MREASGDVRRAFPGQGQQPAEQAEIERLKREIVKLKAEKDILKKDFFRHQPNQPQRRNRNRSEAPFDGILRRAWRGPSRCSVTPLAQQETPEEVETKWKHWPQTAAKRD